MFMAPMKKMSLSWVIAMVIRLHRKMGEHMERQRDTEPKDRSSCYNRWRKRLGRGATPPATSMENY